LDYTTDENDRENPHHWKDQQTRMIPQSTQKRVFCLAVSSGRTN